MEQVLKKEKQIQAKPILKWAGGKTQMLGDIMPKIPQKYGKYIEPFVGGGALFFALSPDKAIIADSNPELINMYRQVADNVEVVISYLKKYKNTKEDFYETTNTPLLPSLLFLALPRCQDFVFPNQDILSETFRQIQTPRSPPKLLRHTALPVNTFPIFLCHLSCIL